MIHTYSYITTLHSKLHEFVIAFFNRIEFETGDFSINFYEQEFYDNLVSHHKDILGKAFDSIYKIISKWEQSQRSIFCGAIRQSNDIEEVCKGNIKPWKETDIPEAIRDITKTLFSKLYESVLKGKRFQSIYGTRREHYHEFKKYANNDHEYCPACGIVEMKTYEDMKTDQYDHYLPKDIYPFSSVNFLNLVPVCADCNSFEEKSNKDILGINGKTFYPFDEQHKGIEIELEIRKDNADDLSKIQWNISYASPDEKNKELNTWLEIYGIKDRYNTHLTGRIIKWYTRYYEYMNDKESINDLPDERRRENSYLRSIKRRKILEQKAIAVLINNFALQAKVEAANYTLFN